VDRCVGRSIDCAVALTTYDHNDQYFCRER
jgi:hypothetical protein